MVFVILEVRKCIWKYECSVGAGTKRELCAQINVFQLHGEPQFKGLPETTQSGQRNEESEKF